MIQPPSTRRDCRSAGMCDCDSPRAGGRASAAIEPPSTATSRRVKPIHAGFSQASGPTATEGAGGSEPEGDSNPDLPLRQACSHP